MYNNMDEHDSSQGLKNLAFPSTKYYETRHIDKDTNEINENTEFSQFAAQWMTENDMNIFESMGTKHYRIGFWLAQEGEIDSPIDTK